MIIAKKSPRFLDSLHHFSSRFILYLSNKLLYHIYPIPIWYRFFFQQKKSHLRCWDNVTHIHPRSHATPISIPLAIEPSEDTLSSGDGLASPELVQVLAHQSAETHEWLKSLGPVGWERLGNLEDIFCLSMSYVDLARPLGINIY